MADRPEDFNEENESDRRFRGEIPDGRITSDAVDPRDELIPPRDQR